MKIITILERILLIAIIIFLPSSLYAFSFYSSENQKFDTSLTEKTETIYLNPTSIYITQVTTASDILQRDPAKWVKALYYYSITRLHFSDLPYTYLMDENGIIYQGNSKGIGANPELQNPEGAIIIGYLSNSTALSNRARESLEKMVDEISYRWGISSVSTANLHINEDESKLSTVSIVESSGEFSNSVKEALSNWKGYEEENLEYKVKIEELAYDKEVEIGERLKVKVKIRNANDFIWFTDKDPIYISTKTEEESSHAINQEWLSFSKPVAIADRVVLPGESVELEFFLEARVQLGDVEESFVLLKQEGKHFKDSEFTLKFEIARGEKQLVEVNSTQYGFVNIRECRWYSCEVLTSVDNGAIFVLEEEEAGWSKIQYGVNLFGWVNSAYLKNI